MSARPTAYQRSHRPVRVAEVHCKSRKPLNPLGFCPDCQRVLQKGGRDHRPGRAGALGWINYYADGSILVTKGS